MMTLAAQPFVCQYCKHKFAKEKTLFVHVCEQKRRALVRTEKHVLIGYQTYNQFYKRTQNAKGDKTYEEFARSPYYNAFVKFGSFVSNVNPLYPDKFIEYVVTSGVKLDHWCNELLYDKYVVDLIKKEPVEVALERSIIHMQTWGEANSAAWNHYFHYVSLSRATYDIKDGKISPWLVLNSNSGKAMLKKFNDEQLNAIASIMDVPYWVNKFKRSVDDVDLVKQIVKESNI